MASLALPSLPPWLQRQAQRLQQAGEPEAHKAARALLPSRKLGALQHATSSGAAVFGSQIPVITVEVRARPACCCERCLCLPRHCSPIRPARRNWFISLHAHPIAILPAPLYCPAAGAARPGMRMWGCL